MLIVLVSERSRLTEKFVIAYKYFLGFSPTMRTHMKKECYVKKRNKNILERNTKWPMVYNKRKQFLMSKCRNLGSVKITAAVQFLS